MTITDNKPTSVIGTRLLRREDPPLLTGEAKFTNDLNIPGALHLSVLRSPFAHAKIKSIDVSAALKIAGVIAVYTGKDLQSSWASPMPCAWPVTADMKNPAHYPLAITPAIFNAAEISIDLIFACAYGERKTERCNAPGIFKSFVNFASPVSSGGSSRRSNLVPITEVGLFSVIVMTDPVTLRSRRRAQT